MIRDLTHHTLYRDERFFASFPAIATLASGEIALLFRRARDQRWFARVLGHADGKALTQVDHVDARSQLVFQGFSETLDPLGPAIPLPPDGEAADQDANLLVRADGSLLVTGFCWYPLVPSAAEAVRAAGVGLYGGLEETGVSYLFWGGYSRLGSADGTVWTDHRFLPPVPGATDILPGIRPHHGGAVRGRPIALDGGGLLAPSYAFGPNGRRNGHVFASDDGLAWRHRAEMASDTKGLSCLVEPALQQTRDGRVIAFFRTTGLDDRLVTATSEDEGRSWSAWRTHEVVGHPYDALRLADGRFLIVYGYRHEPCGVRARLYDPDREEIDDAPEIILRDDAAGPDVGYPWATQARDGSVIIAYYFVGEDGVRRIDASRFEI